MAFRSLRYAHGFQEPTAVNVGQVYVSRLGAKTRVLLAWLLAATSLTTFGAADAHVVIAQKWPACDWQVVPTPNRNPTRMDNALRDVIVISSNDAWAVGMASVAQEGGRVRSTILHWDGARWQSVRHPPSRGQALLSVAGDAADDLWTIGFARGRTAGLAEHWDGTSWQAVKLADPGTRFWHLNGITVNAPDDAWAVGNTAVPSGSLIEHWDGRAWSVVQNPASAGIDPARSSSLEDVAAIAPNDVWAVGEIGATDPAGPSRALLEHWDGAAWHRLQSPPPLASPHPRSDWLFGIAPVSSTDIWAVGSSNRHPGWIGGPGNRQLIAHWNGTKWSAVPGADQQEPGILDGIAASGVFGVWAVGEQAPFVGAALAERWDGTAWSVATTLPAGRTSSLTAIAAGPDGDLWAVGGTGLRHQRTLAMHCPTGGLSITTGATPPHGSIVFDTGGRSRHELAFTTLDGSGPTLMTNAESQNLVAGQAAWSADGSQVAFVVGSRHSWAYTGDGDLYVMNADGSDLHQLLPGIGLTHPTWSPDGSRIAFVRDQGTALCIVNADGSELKVIAKKRGYYQLPSWSPLGDLIAYQSAGHNTDHEAIFTIRPDGTHEHRLVRSPSSTGFPSWSPDGTHLAYSGGDQLRIFDLSTGRSRLVTRCALPACVADFFPAWSPDGSRIVFVRQEEGGAALHLYVIELASGRITRLAAPGRSNSDPSWRP